MKSAGIWIILVFLLIGISVSIAENTTNQTDTISPGLSTDTTDDLMESLARVDVQDTITRIPLPIYAHLLSTNGSEYVLVKASPASLRVSGLPYTILDSDTRNATYAIASRYTDNDTDISGVATILYDDGKHLIIKTGKEATKNLLNAGYHVTWLDTIPRTFRETGVSALQEPPIEYDSRIADMVDRINRDALNSTVASLSGEKPVTVGGLNYTIPSRDASYPELLNTSTEFVYEYLSDRVPNVSFFPFDTYGFDGRNVIGEKTGTEKPDEIILVTAHIDSFSTNGYAPGADDDGSGTAAVMACADIFRQYSFERTIRFVIFSREEDGLYGSFSYARDIVAKNESVVAVFNLDMISWNRDSNPIAAIHTRLPGDAAGYADDMVIAEQFNRSVYLYNISQHLTPRIVSDGEESSDHYSFWCAGYPAVHAIEDDDDFNPYYHSNQDQLERLNLAYFTNFTKASLATVAALSGPVGSPLIITSISPRAAPNYGPEPVINLTGTGFMPNTTVILTRSGSNPLIGEVKSIVFPDTLSCQIPITGADPGAWNVRIQNPDGKTDLIENGFTITARSDSIINASCSYGGTISPSGQIQVPYGANRTFSIIPSSGYQIESVQVNNISVGTETAYTFTNVTTNQTIFGNFTLIPPPPGYFLIVATHDQGGIIEPDGVVTVPQNGSRMFTMTALNGYKINSALVDGIDIGKNTSYTFSSVQGNHTISLGTSQQQGVVLLSPVIPTPPGLGYTYYNPYGSDRNYLIYAPGKYILSEGFSTRNLTAIRIISSDVSLDGNGKSISNSYNSRDGIFAYRVSNITIQNFGSIQDFSEAVFIQNGDSVLVHNISAIAPIHSRKLGITIENGYNCSALGNVIQGGLNGIFFYGGLNNTVTSNRITNTTNGILVHANGTKVEDNNIQASSGAGIEIADNAFELVLYGNRIHGGELSISYLNYGGSGYGAIYNNYLAGSKNVGGDGNGSRYTWTNPAGPKPGTNVAGGPYIAGNYWSNPNGTGWSDREPGNANGYSPTPYEVFPGSNDTAPLVRLLTPTFTPTVTPTPGDYYSINATSNDLGSIKPSGMVSVSAGGNMTFRLQARAGAEIINLTVDGSPASIQPGNTYTFTDVVADHSIQLTCTVKKGVIIAGFNANITSNPSPLTVQFTDSSYGAPSMWFWMFGDGNWSTLQNPVYTYTKAGTKTVRLWVRNLYTSGIITKKGYINASLSGPSIDLVPIPSFTSDGSDASVMTNDIPLDIKNLMMSDNITPLDSSYIS